MSLGAPLPDLDWALTAPFWSAAADGELVLPRCQGCLRFVWYPADRCPRCHATSPVWTRVSGRGRLFSFAVVERGLFKAFSDRVPYVTGLIEIEEDPAVRLVTTIVGVSPDALYMGLDMKVVFGELHFEGDERRVPAPFFTPAAPATSREDQGIADPD